VALFYAELGPGTEREGADELTRSRMSEAATRAFTNVPDVLSSLLLTQFERATERAVRVRSWGESSEGPDEEAGRDGPTEVTALGFVDLVGSTSWAAHISLRDHSLALSRFESAAWSNAVLVGGRVVKMIGDEVFFAAPSADAACQIGTEVCRAAGEDPLLPPARGALGYGAVVSREGDYFGPLVNLISRLVKLAPPGEVVITQEAAARLDAGVWHTRELDPHPVRGLEKPVSVFVVRRLGSSCG
jgi:class 3 adenylate cyclase